MGDLVKLCDELLVALEGECVYYGAPLRRRGHPADPRRLFKLNGLWFEVRIETATEEVFQPGWGKVPESTRSVSHERIVSVDFVTSHDVGPVNLPRPAIVMPGFTDKGNVTLDDSIVTAHRHLVFGNAAPVRGKIAWSPTPLDEGKPWLETATGGALAIVEYETKVRERRDLVEAKFGAVVAEAKARELAALRKARELLDAQSAAENPLWGSW
jgi:hypothetical protein